MKVVLAILLFGVFSICSDIHSSDYSTQILTFDGLPLRLTDGLGFDSDQYEVSDLGIIDLTEFFTNLGAEIPVGCMVEYHIGSNFLITRLPDKTQDYIRTIIEDLYRYEHRIAIARAYVTALEPLSDEKRLEFVLQSGFMPDPIVASLVAQIRKLEDSIFLNYRSEDPFSDQVKDSVSTEDKEQTLTRLEPMKSLLVEVLNAAIVRLKAQLEAIDQNSAEQTGRANSEGR